MVLAACVAMTVVVTIGVAVIPALQSSRTAELSSLNALGTRQPGGAIRRDTRRLLVVGQVAIALTLLAASALAVQSFRHLAAIDLGFDPARVLALDVSRLDQSRYPTDAARQRAIDDLVSRLRQLPGVHAASAVLNRPFAHGVIGWDSGVLLEGQTDLEDNWVKNPVVNFEAITPGYFQTMSIRLRSGRDFATTDRPAAPLVAIVSDTLAARLWPAQDPIGRRLLDSFGRGKDGRSSQWRTVVGVVAAAHYRDVDRSRADLYVPVTQAPTFIPEHIVVRTTGPPRALTPAVTAAMSTVDSQLTVADVVTMDDVVRQVRAPWRFNMLLFSVFSCLSIGLTVVGVAGLTMATVNSQRREIGVRLAFGARPQAVVMMVAMQSARLIAVGVAIGILVSLLTARLLAGFLFGLTATDPSTLIAVAVSVLALGTLAAYVPARRAAKLDPCRIFREE
jgi:predicted permease